MRKLREYGMRNFTGSGLAKLIKAFIPTYPCPQCRCRGIPKTGGCTIRTRYLEEGSWTFRNYVVCSEKCEKEFRAKMKPWGVLI